MQYRLAGSPRELTLESACPPISGRSLGVVIPAKARVKESTMGYTSAVRPQDDRRLVHNLADRPQRMTHWHTRFAAHVTEQRFCPPYAGYAHSDFSVQHPVDVEFRPRD